MVSYLSKSKLKYRAQATAMNDGIKPLWETRERKKRENREALGIAGPNYFVA
jgi:hypothetical protein